MKHRLFILPIVAALTVGVRARSDVVESSPGISLVQRSVRRVACQVSNGPSWKAGAIYTRVVEQLRAAGGQRSVITLHEVQPANSGDEVLSICYELGEMESPALGYALAEIASGDAASMTVYDYSEGVQHSIARLIRWVKSNDLELHGPVVEIMPDLLTPATRNDGVRVILEVPVRRKPIDANTEQGSHPRRSLVPGEKPTDSVEPAPESILGDDILQNNSPFAEAIDVVLAALNNPAKASPTLSADLPTIIEAAPTNDQSHPTLHEAFQPDSLNQLPTHAEASLSELLHGGEIEPAIDRILGDQPIVAVEHLHWLGQVVALTRAAARGVQQVRSEDCVILSRFADSLSKRHKRLYAESAMLTPSSILTASPTRNELEDRKQEVLDALSRILAGITNRRLDAERTLSELGAIFTKVQSILANLDREP